MQPFSQHTFRPPSYLKEEYLSLNTTQHKLKKTEKHKYIKWKSGNVTHDTTAEINNRKKQAKKSEKQKNEKQRQYNKQKHKIH